MRPRQQRFVEEYLVDLNGQQAAIRAGYSKHTAKNVACQLLRRADVAAAVRQGIEARSERTHITADRVLRELARIGFADIGRIVDWGEEGFKLKPKAEISPDDLAAVAQLAPAPKGGLRVRLHSKQRALESMARHLGLYNKFAAHQFGTVPPPGSDGRPAREILRERLEKIRIAEEARQAREAAARGAKAEPEPG
jgi:phage terminase small subunit